MTLIKTVTLAIPCYNEARRLNFGSLAKALEDHPELCLILVDDGSTDKTAEKNELFAQQNPKRVRCLSLARNSGKAEAVRQGILMALHNTDSDYVGYWDADLATPLSQLPLFFSSETSGSKDPGDLIMGSRIQRLPAKIQRSSFRHYLGRVFATAASLLLDLPVYDTQCGAKLFRRELAEKIFRDPFVTSWIFDVELLARTKKIPTSEKKLIFHEAPLLEWREIGGSKLGLNSYITAIFDFMKIWIRYQPRRLR